ncbi:MAG: hypothetical protein OK438_06885 [Thaumarchaeota archaeon]|nr:hypothetical protein [Nitrososphaerota archaeon]
MNTSVLVAGSMVVLLALGIGVGWGITSTVSTRAAVTVTSVSTTTQTQTSSTNASSPYVVTLVVTTGNHFNSTVGEQPAFFILGPNGLQSSAQITIPAHRLIKLVIVNYDGGSANLTGAQYADVTGTVHNQITFVNNTLVNATQRSAGISIGGVQTVSNLDPGVIAHTFTIPALGLNVPIPTASTVIVYFTIDTPGTYTWYCMTICGSGPDGLGGAMATPGWMAGSVVAQ